MSNYYFNSILEYEENCDYNSSIQQKEISFTLIDIDIQIKIESCTDYGENCDQDILDSLPKDSNGDPQIPLYYNDDVKVTAITKYRETSITAGKVNFYYQYNTDDWIQINTEPISINNDGDASVIFKPHRSGKIKVEYLGEPYYSNKNVERDFVLDTIPTKVTFIPPKNNYPPYFVNPKDTISMSVYVNDIKNRPVNHGIVTFLHYYNSYNADNPEAGVERVIGNPVFLKNGIATITYSPMQIFSIDEFDQAYPNWNIFKNSEIISAVYNYDNTEYGVNWHYYKMHQDYTTISILRPYSLLLDIKHIITNEETHLEEETNLDVVWGGIYTLKKNESFVLIATITDENGDPLEIPFKDNNTVVFVINDQEYIGEYNENEKYFKCIIPNKPVGNYEIYAYIPNEHKYFVEQIGQTNTGETLEDAQYLQSLESEHIYLEVEPSDIKCELTLTTEVPYYNINNENSTYSNTNIKVNINVNKEDIYLLKGKECNFNIANQTYTGIIQYDNVTEELFAYPTNNIPVTINNYTVRAYIPSGTYSYDDGMEIVSKNFPTVYSNNITIKVRKNMQIKFGEYPVINNIYPGSIKFVIKGENIFTDILNIKVYLDNDESIFKEYQLDKVQNLIQGIFTDIDVGENHRLYAKVTNEDLVIPLIQSPSFTVNKSILEPNLISSTTYAALLQDILVSIQSTNTEQLNLNNLHFNLTYLEEYLNENEMTIENININDALTELQNEAIILDFNKDLENSTKTNLLLNTTTNCLQRNGNYILSIEYDNDEHYIMTPVNFYLNVINTNPIFNLSFNNIKDTLNGQITHDGTYNNNQILSLLLTFTYENNNQKTKIIQTDIEGNFTIRSNDEIFANPTEWAEWTSITIEFVKQIQCCHNCNYMSSNIEDIQNCPQCNTEELYIREINSESIGYNEGSKSFRRGIIVTETNE